MVIGGAILSPRITMGDTECPKSRSFGAYQVKDGDTLLEIVQNEYQPKDKKTLHQLVALVAKQNNIKDPDKIRAGQVINLPPKLRCCSSDAYCADIQPSSGIIINDRVNFNSKF